MKAKLGSFLHVDSVLPYTFLALLTDEQLVNFLTHGTDLDDMPLDGMLACTRHHLESCRPYKVGKCVLLAVKPGI